MAKVIVLRLEGPLQSWGERGKWGVRDTAPAPTKSGVVGLISCAMGLSDDAPIRDLSAQLEMAVRIDSPGAVIEDYHTIGGGYSKPMLLSAEQKPKKTPGGQPHTELSNRFYLADAAFTVAIFIESETVADQIRQALTDPTWPLYLGRKSCPPAYPIFYDWFSASQDQDVVETLRSVLLSTPVSRYREKTSKSFTVDGSIALILPSKFGNGNAARDEIVSRRYRTYRSRYVQWYSEVLPIDIEVSP